MTMAASKTATVAYPILDLLARRWSPRAFAATPVSEDDLKSLFEAARWAPSCYNDQPWRFIVTRQGSPGFQKLVEAMGDFNKEWASKAPVLALATATTHFQFNGNPNRFADYDVGQAIGHLSVQATHKGLVVHQMAGYSKEAAEASFGLQAKKLNPLALIAIGYAGEAEDLSEALHAKEIQPRSRLALEAVVSFE